MLLWIVWLVLSGMVQASAEITQIEASWAKYNNIQMKWIQFDDGNGNVVMILDRNLGAESAWTGSDSYGNYFQRWNNYWFTSTPETTTTSTVDVSDYGPSNYYSSEFFVNSTKWMSWDVDVVTNMWWWLWDEDGEDLWLLSSNPVTDRQWPCPEWYHVPSAWEWNNLLYLWRNAFSENYSDYMYSESSDGYGISIESSAAADFRNDFLIPNQWFLCRAWGTAFASFLCPQWGFQSDFNISSYLWSSTAFISAKWWSTLSRWLYLKSDAQMMLAWSTNTQRHTNARPVRCFYDSYLDDLVLTLAFETNWWTEVESQKLLKNWTWSLPEDPTKTWYTFAWWYAESDFSGDEFDFNSPITESITLYAKWDINQYSVIFYSDDESILGKIIQDYGTEIDTSQIVTEREWYSFLGRNPSLPSTMPAEDVVVTGAWSINQYTITFNTDGWTQIDSMTQDYGTEVTMPSNPTKTWYTFIWRDKGIPSTMPAKDLVITASRQKVSGGWWWGGGGWWGWSSKTTTTKTRSVAQTGANSSWVVITGNISSWTISTWIIISNNDSDSKDLSASADSLQNFSRYLQWNQSEILDDGYSREMHNAYLFAYNNQITTMNTIWLAKMYSPLTRIAMAKMLSYYAINVLGQQPDSSKDLMFLDVSDALNAQYYDWVTLAYQLWIMWINMPDNKFRPNDRVTRAEFGTALSRMLFGLGDGNPYYLSHLAKLKSEWIITNDEPNLEELRWYVMLMLMRSKM